MLIGKVSGRAVSRTFEATREACVLGNAFQMINKGGDHLGKCVCWIIVEVAAPNLLEVPWSRKI